MTTTRDPDRLIRAFLADGQSVLPERVYDAVDAHIDAAGFRPAAGVGRLRPSFVRLAAAVIVVVAAAIALNLPSPGESPTASPPAPAAHGSAPPARTTHVDPLPLNGEIVAGRYYLSGVDLPISLTVPTGWWSVDYGRSVSNLPRGAEGPRVTLTVHDVTGVETVVCGGGGALVDVGPTVDDLTQALVGQIGATWNGPFDASVGGRPARRLTVSVPGTCGPLSHRIWEGADSFVMAGGETATVYLVDVDGQRVVFTAHDQHGRPRDVDALDAIVASIAIEPQRQTGPEAIDRGASSASPGVDAIPPQGEDVAARFTIPFRQMRIQLTLPTGWSSSDHGRTISKYALAGPGPRLTLAVRDPVAVEANVCGPTSLRTVGPTMEDLADALAEQVGPSRSGPIAFTLDGRPGRRLQLALPDDCPGPVGRRIWTNASGNDFYLLPGMSATVYILDVHGERLVITIEERGTTREDTAQLEAIVASIAIEPSGGAIGGSVGDPRLGESWQPMSVDGVPFWFRLPTNRPWEGIKDDVYVSVSSSGSQSAEAIVLWSSFPGSAASAAEPCPALSPRASVPSGADLAAAMSAAHGVELLSGPSGVEVGGRAATHVALVVREDRGCDPGYFFSWRPRDGGAFWTGTEVGDSIQLWIVDVAEKRLVIESETRAEVGHDLDAQIQQIVDSVEF